jgi:hypothetical protein
VSLLSFEGDGDDSRREISAASARFFDEQAKLLALGRGIYR